MKNIIKNSILQKVYYSKRKTLLETVELFSKQMI